MASKGEKESTRESLGKAKKQSSGPEIPNKEKPFKYWAREKTPDCGKGKQGKNDIVGRGKGESQDAVNRGGVVLDIGVKTVGRRGGYCNNSFDQVGCPNGRFTSKGGKSAECIRGLGHSIAEVERLAGRGRGTFIL